MDRPFINMDLKYIKTRNKNKFYEEKIILPSVFYTSTMKTIAVYSDIHYHKNIDKEVILLLILYAQMIKPDYIIMPGDMVDNSKFLNNFQDKKYFEYFIKALSEISKVIMIPGNHETHDMISVSWLFSDNLTQTIKYFESLNRLKNVYFLDNSQIRIDNINFISYTPPHSTYYSKSKRTIDKFMNGYIKSGLTMDDDKYNILLTHNPIPLTISNEYKKIDDFNNSTDLVISGHLHNGYLPRFMYEKYKNTNMGLFFAPFINPLNGFICRGIHNFGNRGKLFVSKGYKKWASDLILFNFFEKFTSNDVELLTLINPKDKSLILKK